MLALLTTKGKQPAERRRYRVQHVEAPYFGGLETSRSITHSESTHSADGRCHYLTASRASAVLELQFRR